MNLRTETGKPYFYQWDTGQLLIVEDAPNCRQVHFGYRDGSEARVCDIREEEGMRVVDIPNELLQKDRTFFAYLINDEDDETQMRPQSFLVLLRPKPDDYVYTQTEVQTYEALEERITALEENGGSGGGTVKTVNGVVPDENGNVEIVIPDTEADIPATLPNPNALTFTGAVEATYDGSEAVSVEIPSGGGLGSWRLLKSITVAENIKAVEFDTDNGGNSFEVTELLITTDATTIESDASTAPNLNVSINGKDTYSAGTTAGLVMPYGKYGASGGRNYLHLVSLNPAHAYHGSFQTGNVSSNKTVLCWQTNYFGGNPHEVGEKITKVKLVCVASANYLAEGSRFEVYGR